MLHGLNLNTDRHGVIVERKKNAAWEGINLITNQQSFHVKNTFLSVVICSAIYLCLFSE